MLGLAGGTDFCFGEIQPSENPLAFVPNGSSVVGAEEGFADDALEGGDLDVRRLIGQPRRHTPAIGGRMIVWVTRRS